MLGYFCIAHSRKSFRAFFCFFSVGIFSGHWNEKVLALCANGDVRAIAAKASNWVISSLIMKLSVKVFSDPTFNIRGVVRRLA